MSQVHEVIAAKQREVDWLLSLPGVTGVAVGHKWVGGKATDEVAIHVYVERKLAEGELRPADRIPPTIGGHKTDVIEAGPFVHANGDATPDDKRYRPLQPGAQITRGVALSPLEERVGTISCLVQGTVLRYEGGQLYEEPNPGNSKPFLVTCAHVAFPALITHLDVYQPSALVVATVFTGLYGETVDAALCQLNDGINFNNNIPEIGPITGWLTERLTDSARLAALPYRVRKYGRTTRYTESGVISVEGTFEIKPDPAKPGPKLHSLLLINPTATGGRFADAGDSGAPVVNDSGELVGIVAGLDLINNWTVACQAADVFAQLAEAMRARCGPDPSDSSYVGVGLQLAPFTRAAREYPPVELNGLVPIYRHQSRELPDRYFYDRNISSVNSEWRDGEEAFVAYGIQEPGTQPIYRHFAPNPDRYYYDTRSWNYHGWSRGEEAFYAFPAPRPEAIPIYRHRANPPDPDRYYYDTQIQNDHGWTPGQIAFWAYPKYSREVVLDALVSVYRHKSRGYPDRYFYDTKASSLDSEYEDGKEAFVAYATQQFETKPIYRHVAADPRRYYYDTQIQNDYGWGPGEVTFFAFTGQRLGAVPIYRHRASDPDRYYYDTQVQNDHGWSAGEVAFWAYPKGISGAVGRGGA